MAKASLPMPFVTFDDGQRHGGRDRRVDRVAAFGQHGEPRLGGEWLTGGDAIGGENRLADRRVGKSPVHA